MQIEPIISYRHLDPSDAVTAHVQKRLAALEHFHHRIVGCEVTLDAPQKRKRTGRIVRAKVDLRLPGDDIHVERSIARGSAREDLLLAINRAFAAAEKTLKHHRKVKGGLEVKPHPPVLHGEITRLEPELGYGYVEADDGHEVYFQRQDLTADRWDRLHLGSRLRFREMQGDKGPYAASVTLLEKDDD